MDDSLVPDKNSLPPFVSDYRYASEADIRAVTLNHLATLEAELHTLRMAFVGKGQDPNILVAADRTIGLAMKELEASINAISEHFAVILVGSE